MSVGPLAAPTAAAAGVPLAQSKGTEVVRAGQDAGAQQRQVYTDLKADAAAGIGETDGQDHETAERDADGRRPWERPTPRNADEASADEASGDGSPSEQAGRSKDATGAAGTQLDLTG